MAVKGDLLLHRRWRLRAAGSAAYWGIYTFTPAPDEGSILLSVGLYPLADLLAKPCLFLLGRPGAGKTAEFRMHFAEAKFPGESLIALEARHLDGAGAESIFHSPQWLSALAAGKSIRLVLDGVDEALLGRGAFLDGLRHQLGFAKSAAQEKGLEVSLVLTCRLAEWDDKLAGEIAELWGLRAEDCAYELAPLSAKAALDLAAENGAKDRKAFAAAWSKGDMESYACWPRTLIWLAEEYARDRKISSSLTELHERRCSRQFEDADRSGRLVGKLTPERIAQWNEAVALLACAVIATGVQRFVVGRPAGERELDIGAFATALAKLPKGIAGAFPTHAEAFRDALKFGDLFERAGEVWLFQEQSDAEFLAARRLARLPVEQLAEFFGSETRHGWQVFPQLATTAAMAAVHSGGFRQWLLDHDPLILIRSDFAAISETDKTRAVEALLDLIDSGKAPDAHEHPSHLQTLGHSKLAGQLRPWLHDHRRNPDAREMALRIAAACADEKLADELGEDIWQLATGSETEKLSWLSLAISTIGVCWPKERLMAIAKGELPPGPHWSSRGAALYALFDESRNKLPASEQAKLSEIVPFFDLNPTGVWSSYDSFIRSCHEYFHASDTDEVCKVLGALKKWRAPLETTSSVEKLAFAALTAAVGLMPDETAIAALVEWWFAAIRDDNYQTPGQNHACSLADIGLDAPEKRRVLLDAMLRHPAVAAISEHQLDELPCESADFAWLLARLPQCTGTEERIVARLIGQRIYRLALREENLVGLRAAFSASAELRSLLPPAPDGDIHAVLLRVEEENEQRWKEKEAERKSRKTPRPEYDAGAVLPEMFEIFANGKTNAWPWMLQALSDPESHELRTGLWDATHPEQLSGWTKLSDEQRLTIRQAARAYLIHHPPTLPERNQSHLGVQATLHALSLWRTELATDGGLRSAFCAAWVETVLRSLYPAREPLPQLLSAFCSLEPSTTLVCIRAQLEFEWSSNRYLLAEHLDPIWSPELRAILVEILSRSPIQPESYRTGITWLMRHEPTAAAELALDRCDEPKGQAPPETRYVAIGTALLAFPEHWQRVWPLVTADATAGLKCLAWVAGNSERLGWQKAMIADAKTHAPFIAALYGWLLKHLPPEPERRDGYTPNGIDHCRDLERACYQALLDLGRADLLRQAFTFAGVSDRPWAQRVERKSERNAHARAWQPWALPQFAEWLTNEGGIRIIDDESLMRAVDASLRRFEAAWKRQIPPHFLWDLKSREPLREKFLSDVLKTHLEHDLVARLVPREPGIVINREPQFFSEEQVDLLIEKPLADGSWVRVVVEVKLCDNDNVETDMETQLAERYLRQKGLIHGIYFVGWMTCADWPKHLTSFQRGGTAKARRTLEQQAARLRKEGLIIRVVLAPCPLSSKRRISRKPKARPTQRGIRR